MVLPSGVGVELIALHPAIPSPTIVNAFTTFPLVIIPLPAPVHYPYSHYSTPYLFSAFPQ